jgi:hypothetical protein
MPRRLVATKFFSVEAVATVSPSLGHSRARMAKMGEAADDGGVAEWQGCVPAPSSGSLNRPIRRGDCPFSAVKTASLQQASILSEAEPSALYGLGGRDPWLCPSCQQDATLSPS